MSQRNPEQELKRKSKGRSVPGPDGTRFASQPAPVRFSAEGHINPITYEPLVRLIVGNQTDLSIPAGMMRKLVDLINAQIILAELESGFARESATRPGLMAAEFPAPTVRESILEGTADFRNVLRDVWAVGSTIEGLQYSDAPPPADADVIQTLANEINETIRVAAQTPPAEEQPT